jgi:hypothetical protein
VIPDSDVIGSPGLDEAVRILFGGQAEEKLAEYLRDREIPVAP